MRKETDVAYTTYYTHVNLKGLGKTTKILGEVCFLLSSAISPAPLKQNVKVLRDERRRSFKFDLLY